MTLNPDAWRARPIVTELHMSDDGRWFLGKVLPLTAAQKRARRLWRLTVLALGGLVGMGCVGAVVALVVSLVADGSVW